MGHSIHLLDSDLVFDCARDQSVLAALAPVHHERIRSGCHGGGCGVCKVRVCAGQFHTGCMSRAHVSEVEQASGVALACRLYADSDLTIEPWGKLTARFARREGFVATHRKDRTPRSGNLEG